MYSEKKHNFGAGPCILPESVLSNAAESVLNWNDSGLSVLEVSHRSHDSLKQEVNWLLSGLQKREQKIIGELFGLNGLRAMSLDEVARRNDLSSERIRQIKAAAMKILRSNLPQRLTEYL